MKFLLFICFASFLIFSCRKDSYTTSADARIRFTVDTLKFDTVFATAGSVTRSFKIINENNRRLRVNSVRIMGGASSAFKINVDGVQGPAVTDLEIDANDSLYVFVQVNVDPGAANLPFVITDSIQVTYNGNTTLVQLEAWGQNAHFFRDKQVLNNETWVNDLPYVILGFLYVDTGQTLTINPGCRIYVHADAPVIVDGTLQVNGLKDESDRVYFQGDRLDDPYKEYPASWPGIYFLGSSINNVMNYAVIKNAFQAIGVENPATNANPKLTLNECVIDNAFDAGIIAVNSSIRARNCLISNCGKNVSLSAGGSYAFDHCTVVSYSNFFIQHKEPVLSVSNSTATGSLPLDARFRNCIFWGEGGLVTGEVAVIKNGSTAYSVVFDQVLWKVTGNPANATVIAPAAINGQPPVFDSINTSGNYYNFRLRDGSPALDKGMNAGVLTDLDGHVRPVGLPDLGCYERQ